MEIFKNTRTARSESWYRTLALVLLTASLTVHYFSLTLGLPQFFCAMSLSLCILCLTPLSSSYEKPCRIISIVVFLSSIALSFLPERKADLLILLTLAVVGVTLLSVYLSHVGSLYRKFDTVYKGIKGWKVMYWHLRSLSTMLLLFMMGLYSSCAHMKSNVPAIVLSVLSSLMFVALFLENCTSSDEEIFHSGESDTLQTRKGKSYAKGTSAKKASTKGTRKGQSARGSKPYFIPGSGAGTLEDPNGGPDGVNGGIPTQEPIETTGEATLDSFAPDGGLRRVANHFRQPSSEELRELLSRDRDILPSTLRTERLNELPYKLGQVYRRLYNCMVEQKMFLDPECNLTTLAKAAKTNKTYVTKVLNGTVHLSFTQYVNAYRVNYAMQLFKANNSLKTTDLCRLSGFTTMSSFIYYFKFFNSDLTPYHWCSLYAERVRREKNEKMKARRNAKKDSGDAKDGEATVLQ